MLKNNRTIGIEACENYDPAVVYPALKRTLEQIGGLSWLRPGMTVAIKTNLVSGSDPEKAIVTHPVILEALTRLLLEASAKTVIIGDSPGGPFTEGHLQRIYRATTGLDDAVKAGAVLNTNTEQKTEYFAEGVVMKEITCTGWLLKADAIIGVCKLKTHGMMRMSANVKNFFGAIPGTMKAEYHFRYPKYEDFADMLVDINEYLKPVLYITDAVIGMEGNGPTSGTPRKIGALLASANPYDLDHVCARIIGLDPKEVPTIAAALKRDLMDPMLETDDLSGRYLPFVVKDYKNIEEQADILFADNIPGFVMPFAKMVLEPRPRVQKKNCIGCKKCQKVCPAKAITMKKGKPVIDRNACIRCFCCQEFCPKGAMRVHRSLPAKLLQKK